MRKSLDQGGQRPLWELGPQGSLRELKLISWRTRPVWETLWLFHQDLSEAMSAVELQRELGLQVVDSQREVFFLGASIAPVRPGSEDPGTVHIWKLLLQLLS